MIETIIKRDGSRESFDIAKIAKAIEAAGKESGEFGESEAARLANRVSDILAKVSREQTVEDVQNVVEHVLLASRYKATGRAYIVYREQHAALRTVESSVHATLIDRYLNDGDRENANMAYSLQGLNYHLSSEATRKFWLHTLYSPAIREAHESGDFHLHDLNSLASYCVGWDLADLLRQGFRGVAGKVESAPAKHFGTALGQMQTFIFTLQGECAGAQAMSSVDTLLAPFIRHDGLTFEQVKQEIQAWVFNMNMSTRVGFQCPFSNITLDINVPARLRDEPVVIGGELQSTTYGDYQREMDLFNRAFLEVMCAGDSKGRVFTFPIPTYNISKDFDYDDPRLGLLWEATAKYGLPYFANFVNSDMDPEDARSMCCRLRLDTRELQRRGGGLFGANPLTGSIGVVTLNMPRIGHLATTVKDFFARLYKLMDLARDSLIIKRKVLERYTNAGLYPYSKHYLESVHARTGQYWANHFSTIGLIGLNEAVINFLNRNVMSDSGRGFAERVLTHMRDRLVQYQEETGTPFNLEATPAEGTSFRLTSLDRKQHPQMRALLGSNLVYSNSSQPPVDATHDPFALLDAQDALQAKYTGGTVLHFFLGERISDPSVVKQFVRKVCSGYRLPYFTLTPTFSVCPEHGYLVGEQHKCPMCGVDTEVYSRVVGYLRPVAQWNDGKRAEFEVRSTYDSGLVSASA